MTEVINNGGPAFPSGNEVTLGDWRSSGHSGMNLRDYFAAKAMEALLSRLPRSITPQECIVVAEDAYFMADHMLKAREAKND